MNVLHSKIKEGGPDMKTALSKQNYKMVTIIYSDYSDFSETFETGWGKREAINFLLEQPYHKYKLEIGLQVREITISEVTKYNYIED